MIDLSSLEREDLEAYCIRLKRRIVQLEKENLDYSWKVNPDRMGGQFDSRDYEQLRRSEQGIFS